MNRTLSRLQLLVHSHRTVCTTSSSCAAVRPRPSYCHGVTTVPLIHETPFTALRATAERYADRQALVFPEDSVRLTYEQFIAEVIRVASGLIALGLRPGDRVGIWGPNTVEWMLTQYACSMIGLILVNVNPAYQSEELSYVLRKVDVSALVMCDKFKSQDYYHILVKACHNLPNSKPGDIQDNRLPELRHVVVYGDTMNHTGVWSWNDLLNAADAKSTAVVDEFEGNVDVDAPCNIQFTSGTTGQAKAATLSAFSMVNNAYSTGVRIGYDLEHHTLCVVPPLYHCLGSVVGALAGVVHNSTLVFPSRAFNPGLTIKAVDEEKCTSLYGTPTMFIDMLNHDDFDKYDYSTLKTGVMAGSPCPVEVCRSLIEKMHMKGFVLAYGSTETAPASFISFPTEPAEERVKSVGTVLDHVEAKVVDAEGRTLPLGEKGELLTRGYNTMLGYWDDEEKTKAAVGADRWYSTGDLATMDEHNRVMIVGRAKDMIIRGGENIYPTEIEQLMYTNEHIEDVHVVGVPDDRLGEEVCAWVRLHHSTPNDFDDAAIRMWCKGKIAHFKIPRYIMIKEEADFPLTISGKVQKFEIRAKAIEELNL